mgnify:FL=1
MPKAKQKRIDGLLTKQVWQNDYAIDVSNEFFDATEAVLRLRLDEIQDLTDHSYDSDGLASASGVMADHSGPFEVEVESSIRAFFEVDSLAEITQEMLDRARGNEKTTKSKSKKKKYYANHFMVTVISEDKPLDDVDQRAFDDVMSDVLENRMEGRIAKLGYKQLTPTQYAEAKVFKFIPIQP